ncbi:3403_t:CDS:2 [Cetraspora pellucida]|uniref:3403_t:CDS:1 n=1 Tax=Cetraspora pellucida TaxID=1433469 RepID=A0A9N9NJH5_9GLOM|nr:3403_t:CDS:2 [Cetraspora pellucida]
MSQEGFWPITSSVDWCESNYVHSHYIAEFWNSVSSIAMIILGEVGARINPCNSFRFKLAFRLISVVGTGSFLFHGTLTSQMQALDEVPMVWTAITLLHPLIETNFGRQGIWLPITQVICAIFCTLAVTVAKGTLQFIFFHITFGLLEIALLVLMSRIYFKKGASHPAVKHLFERGIMIYALGVIVWLVDMHFCDYVNSPFLPFNPQLHAFWHIFASTGLYFLVTLILYNWYYENGTKCKIEYRYGGIVPVIVKDYKN